LLDLGVEPSVGSATTSALVRCAAAWGALRCLALSLRSVNACAFGLAGA
jgi:hypothetical protein